MICHPEKLQGHQREKPACPEPGSVGLAMSKIVIFDSTVRRKIRVLEVDSFVSQVPVIPITNVHRQACFLAAIQRFFPDPALAKFGVIEEQSFLDSIP